MPVRALPPADAHNVVTIHEVQPDGFCRRLLLADHTQCYDVDGRLSSDDVPSELVTPSGVSLAVSVAELSPKNRLVISVRSDPSEQDTVSGLTEAELNAVTLLREHCQHTATTTPGVPAFVQENLQLWNSTITKLQQRVALLSLAELPAKS